MLAIEQHIQGKPIKKIEWSKNLQLEFFLERMKKSGKTMSDQQIGYIKEYLKTTPTVEVYKEWSKEEIKTQSMKEKN